MLNQYLGSYLLNNNLVNHNTLNDILEKQRNMHIKLGVLAINNGLMTAKQVNEINELQKRYDKRFGELAVEQGYLTEDEVTFLLSQQKSSSVELSQLLIDNDIFTLEDLENILNDYREENSIYLKEENEILGDPHKILRPFIEIQCDSLNVKEWELYYEYSSLLLRNLVRFIDHGAFLDTSDQKFCDDPVVISLQEIQGVHTINSYLAMSENTFIKFASKYAKIHITDKDELAEASVTEFLNLNNGLFTINMSDKDLAMKLRPPMIIEKTEDLISDLNVHVPFNSELGKICLILKPL